LILKGEFKGAKAKVKTIHINRFVCDLELVGGDHTSNPAQMLLNMEYDDFSKLVQQ